MLIIRLLPRPLQIVIYLLLGLLALIAAGLTARDGYPVPAIAVVIGAVVLLGFGGLQLANELKDRRKH